MPFFLNDMIYVAPESADSNECVVTTKTYSDGDRSQACGSRLVVNSECPWNGIPL